VRAGMDKQAAYADIVKQVNKCNLCDGTTARSRDKTNQVGLDHLATNHVNLWSYWQGNLSPEILVLGQDWGELPNFDRIKIFIDSEAYRKIITIEKNATDFNLVKLFDDVFSVNILKEQKLFFTNSVFCYKKGNLNENVCTSWFRNCNEHFMSNLILLLEPKCIITLGNKALHGLSYSGNIIYTNGSLAKIKNISLTALLDNPNQLWWENFNKNKRIKLFPLFHPGGYSARNRPYQQQLNDWNKIKPFVN